MEQVETFREEAEKLHTLLLDCPAELFTRSTSFKEWTPNDILRHLYVWNKAAEFSASDEDALIELLNKAIPFVMDHNLRPFERDWAPNLAGPDILALWWQSCESLMETFKGLDPKARLKWAGPSMSARSSITARLMETWSHAQAIYDLLGTNRVHGGALKDIAQLGVQTFGWTFKNRKMDVPEDLPFIKLTGPNGENWEWNEDTTDNRVEGNALDFCHVVTQARNIEDTELNITGEIAQNWMSIAQCFAGPPETPPEKGMRVK